MIHVCSNSGGHSLLSKTEARANTINEWMSTELNHVGAWLKNLAQAKQVI